MDTINTFINGFKVITTPYDKVDHTTRNINKIIKMVGGEGEDKPAEGAEGAEGAKQEEVVNDADKAAAKAADPAEPKANNNEEEPEKKGFFARQKEKLLEKAKAGEQEEVTELPEGKYLTENIVKIGTIIIYIMLLPLLPWYYVMKYSFQKLRRLFDGMLKPL
jgi:uncharacterized membrane protein